MDIVISAAHAKKGLANFAKNIQTRFVSNLPNTASLVEYNRLSIKLLYQPANLAQALYEARLGRVMAPPISFVIRDESDDDQTSLLCIEWSTKYNCFIMRWLNDALSGSTSGSESVTSAKKQSVTLNPFSPTLYGSTTQSETETGLTSSSIMRVAFADKSNDVLGKLQHPNNGVTMYKIHDSGRGAFGEFDIRRSIGHQSHDRALRQFVMRRQANVCLGCLFCCCRCASDHSITKVFERQTCICEVQPQWSMIERNVTLLQFVSGTADGEARAVGIAVGFLVHLTTVHPQLQGMLETYAASMASK